MTRRKWLVFAAIQLVGCVAAHFGRLPIYDDVLSGLALFCVALHVIGFFLLLPGNILAGALLETFWLWLYSAGWLYSADLLLWIYFPLAVTINAGFWLLCAAAWRTAREHFSGVRAHPYAIAFLTATTVFTLVNVVHFRRPATCADCFLRDGVPFPLYHEGGFAGGAAIMWGGLAADALIVAAVAMLFGAMWRLVLRKTSR